MKSLDSQVYFDTLLELNAFAIKYAMRHWFHKLSSHHHNHEEFQSNSKNNDKNKAFKAV